MENKEQNLSYVNIEELKPSQYNTFSTDEYSDLKESIRAMGLLTPLTVVGVPGSYEILSGERRFRAISDLHKENAELFAKVPVYIVGTDTMNTTKQQIIIEISNLELRSESDYNVHDHRFCLLRLIKEMSNSPEEEDKLIADIFMNSMKLSNRYKNMYKNVFDNGNEDLISLVTSDEKHVSLADASNIAELDKDKQEEAVKRISDGEKARDVYNDITGKGNKNEAQSETDVQDDPSEMPSFDTDMLDAEETVISSAPASSSDYEPDDEYEDDEDSADLDELMADFDRSVSDDKEEEEDDDYDFSGLFGKNQYNAEDYIPDAMSVVRWLNQVMSKERADFTPDEEEAYELAEKWVDEKRI